MNSKLYSDLMNLIATSRERAETLDDQMQVLMLHGDEDAKASAGVVQSAACNIEKDLSKAIDMLNDSVKNSLQNRMEG